MMEKGRGKRETRRGYVDYLQEGGGVVVLFVFRGGWIDAIVMKRGLQDLRDLVSWLKETGYFEGISGIAFGEGFRKAFGGNMGEKYLEIPVKSPSSRNVGDANVIIEGIRQWLSKEQG
ncbi:MAG: hypothetical protein QXO23_06410 [Candidatus Methanomethyliaceae archaeon]